MVIHAMNTLDNNGKIFIIMGEGERERRPDQIGWFRVGLLEKVILGCDLKARSQPWEDLGEGEKGTKVLRQQKSW